ncbi:MAG TPA: haloacid dehalogenase type II [Candidatus Limnocylindrales bacterium]|nr:haloacid dehalogenase type II [Candidatus Limnocylindrales bacterium]
MTDLDYSAFDALTFDCYGTLIDWEAGILAALRTVLPAGAGDGADDEALLVEYANAEATLENGPYRRYREIAGEAMAAVARAHGAEPTPDDIARLGGSVADWPAFPDSHDALERLRTRFRLGVLTNCDDDLFAASNERLGVTFDWVVTAQQVGSYKPDEQNFGALLERLGADGLPQARILHVAQSLFHDHEPAQRLGFRSVWIDRRHDRAGAGATPPAAALQDATFPSMAAFAAAAVPD